MKYLKIKLVDRSTLTYELEEDGQKGDRFSFNNELNLFIEEQKKQIVEQTRKTTIDDVLQNHSEVKQMREQIIFLTKRNEESNEKVAHSQRQISESANAHKMEIFQLKEKINTLETTKDNQIQKEIATQQSKLREEFENKNSELIQKFYQQKEALTNQIKEKEANLINQLNQEKLKFQEEMDEKIKHAAKIKLEEELELRTQVYVEKIKSLEEQNKSLQEDVDKFRERNVNSKLIGEGLEQWILENYNRIYPSIDTSSEEFSFTLVKDNTVVEGEDGATKADFIYTINNNKTGQENTIIVEAKSESKNKEGNQKNASFFRRLESNRKKKGAKYGILVTELEDKNYFTIEKVPGYEKLYMCRPYFFLSFLNILKTFIIKESKINEISWNFEESSKILEIFNKWKEDKIMKLAEKIKDKLEKIIENAEDINKLADKITKQADNIRSAIDEIISKHSKKLTDEIESFNITRKIIKPIEKIENNN